MAAASAEVCVGLTSKPRVVLGHRLDHELRFRKELVQASADDRISLVIENDPALEIARGRQSSHARIGDRVSVDLRVILGSKDRDHGRRIDDHDGSPPVVVEQSAMI
jgi:hypothetical protein